MRGPALFIGILALAGCVSLPDVPPPVAGQDADPGYPALIPLGDLEFDAAREDAEAWFNEDWSDWMKSRFGVRPTLTFYDNPVLLDNERDEVRVEGAPIAPPWVQKA